MAQLEMTAGLIPLPQTLQRDEMTRLTHGNLQAPMKALSTARINASATANSAHLCAGTQGKLFDDIVLSLRLAERAGL